jgi:hypothetical protein
MMDIPDKVEHLRETNMLEGWIKGIICGTLPERSIHSTFDSLITEDSVEGFISYISSNIAFNRYSFGRCGRNDLNVKETNRDDIGRKYVEYLDRLKEDRIQISFGDLVKKNERIGNLSRAISSGNLVGISPLKTPTNGQVMSNSDGNLHPSPPTLAGQERSLGLDTPCEPESLSSPPSGPTDPPG